MRSTHIAGIGMMLLAMLMFSANDALGKWLVATYSVGQIMLLRSFSALGLLAPFVARSGGLSVFRDAPRPLLQALRALLATLETAGFYLAVSYMPLADTMTFYLAGPIYVTALSALILREKVGIYRWSAVIVGFAGVVIALNPSAASFSPGAVIALFGSLAYAVLMIVTRYLRDTSNVVLTGMQAVGGSLLGILTAPFGWSPVTLPHMALLLLLGAVSIGAITFVNQSLKLAPASVVVPYQYTMIVWAMLFGYLVFGDVPHLNVIVGALVIVASGLFIFLREQQVARREAAPLAEH